MRPPITGNYLIEAAEESEVGKRLRTDPGLSDWHFNCVSCPVWIEFRLDGFPATFRARGSYWWFIVGAQNATDHMNVEQEQLLNLRAFYDHVPVAGYIEMEDAHLLIEQGIAAFRSVRNLSPLTLTVWNGRLAELLIRKAHS